MSFNALEFLAEFRAEATEHVAALDEQLLRLERNPMDRQPVRAMFLAAHSIKGGAAMLGLDELRELSHALEDVLGVLRDQERPLDPSTAEVLFRAVDQLRVLVPLADGLPHSNTPQTQAIMAALAACSGPPTPLPESTPGAAPHVLLVEDSPSIRQVESFLLRDAGFVVDTAVAGNEAVERARAVHYDLVIAGIETQDLRGPDLARALRAGTSGANLQVLLTTTDYNLQTPAATAPVDLAFGPKGSLGDGEFVRHVRELLGRSAA